MRYLEILTLGIALAFLQYSCKETVAINSPDDTSHYIPSDSAKMYFLADATDFAVDYLFATRSPDTSKVFISVSILNKYLLPLACLYDRHHEIPILDTLLVQSQIHKEIISSSSLLIKVDTALAWAKNVKKGISPTGNLTVDSLMQLYNLRFRPDPLWGLQGLAWLTTIQSPLNTYALGQDFLSAAGVVSAEPNNMISIYSKLYLIIRASETTIYLYKGYGDCPLGCFGYDRWTFTVSKNFEVTYQGYLHQ